MPRLDGTGPAGQGPMTGRVMGPCGYGVADCPFMGRGRRIGYGFGRRWIAPENDLQALQAEYEALGADIDDLKAEKEALKREIEAVKKQSHKE